MVSYLEDLRDGNEKLPGLRNKVSYLFDWGFFIMNKNHSYFVFSYYKKDNSFPKIVKIR